MKPTNKPSIAHDVFYPPRTPERSRAPEPPVVEAITLPPPIHIPKEPAVVYEKMGCIVCRKVGDVVGAGYPLQMPANYATNPVMFSDWRGSHGAWGGPNDETYVTMSVPLVEFLRLYHGHLAGPCGNEERER